MRAGTTTMIESMAAFFGIPEFLLLAFLAGSIVAVLSGFFGAFVVQRSLGFLGNGLAHAAFGGVALGILLDVEPLAVTLPFTLAISAGIVWLRDHSRLGADTIIGIFFSVSMALGILLLSQTPRYTTDAFAYLFGSILSVRPMDLVATSAAAVVTLACAPLWGRWAYATFDRELAMADKLPAQRDDYLLAGCLAIVIVVAMKVVGITLIAAFLVIPPAAARLVARTFAGMTVLSIVLGVASVFAGLAVAWRLDWPAGASIILVQSAVFGVALLLRRD